VLGELHRLHAPPRCAPWPRHAPQDEISAVVARLFARRNALVHPKTHEVAPSRQDLLRRATPLSAGAREAVEDMRRFHQLFLAYDTDAVKWWHI
jgi:hypothetical protein